MTLRLLKPGEGTHKLRAKVRVPGAGRLAEFELEAPYLERAALEAVLHDDRDFMRAVALGWSGIEDADGSPLAWSPEAVDTLAGIGYFVNGVVDSYLR